MAKVSCDKKDAYETSAMSAWLDVNKASVLFGKSEQKFFNTVCDKCGKAQRLSEELPACIAEHTSGPDKGKICYICKFCRGEITNPQNGYFASKGEKK